jgi:hypothetical protein
MITMKTVESSNIEAIGYADQTLAVKFKSGDTYHYNKVPVEVFEAFDEAKSKGSFFASTIRKGFAGIKQKRDGDA